MFVYVVHSKKAMSCKLMMFLQSANSQGWWKWIGKKMYSKKVMQPRIDVCVVWAHNALKESSDLLQSAKCKHSIVLPLLQTLIPNTKTLHDINPRWHKP
jgi:hypothetical protein